MLDLLPRRRWRRRSRPYWLLSVAGALVAGLVTAGTVQRAEQTIADYGTRSRVAVASADLAIGDVVEEADVTWRELPEVLVAGSPVADPVGRTVVSPVLRGEPLAGERLAPGGLSTVEALIGPGRRAIVIDLVDDLAAFARGARVDVLAGGSTPSGSARWVARDATIVDVGERSATVAVDEADAPGAARAALDGAVVLALIGEP